MSRLVCVSNRISLPRKSAAPGGLAIGILSALKRTGGLWFGWGGETVEQEPGDPDIHIREGVTYATIDLKKQEFDLYYNGYANEVLWPLFHYFQRGMRYAAEQRDAYESVNRTFAQKLAPLLEPDDVIWVHDYHLIPLGRRLRELGVRRPLGFFLHIPFPNIEMLRVLPAYAELLRDLTSYDVVGFQTQNDLRSFHSGIEHLCGPESLRADGRIRVGDRTLRADVFPIGVDVDSVQAEAERVVAGGSREAHDRQPDGPRADDRRRPARLQQGPGRALPRVSAVPGNVSRQSRPHHVPADRAAVALRRARLRGDPPGAGAGGRPHQRPLRRHGLDADPLSEPEFPARDADGIAACVERRHRHAVARRHEPGRQGIRGRAGSRTIRAC